MAGAVAVNVYVPLVILQEIFPALVFNFERLGMGLSHLELGSWVLGLGTGVSRLEFGGWVLGLEMRVSRLEFAGGVLGLPPCE